MSERWLLTIIIIAVLLVSAGYWVATHVDLMPEQASTNAVLVDGLFRFLLGLATVIFLLVEGALLYAVFRFRRRLGDAAPVHGNNALQFVWSLIPAVIVVIVAYYSFRVLSAASQSAPDPLTVEVRARQFSCQFRYPESGVTTQELHLPVGRAVRLLISADDVIHSFWVPQFRVKQDATPGSVSELLVSPLRTGRFPIRCAELCGPGHATMTAEVVVESPQEFAVWLASQLAPRATPSEPTAAGRELFNQYGCGACHTLADGAARGAVGPSLDGVGTRAAQRVPGLDARAYLEQSILDPNAYVVPGYPSGVMPQDFGQRLSADVLRLLVDYLLSR
ncbi:MAG: cytochrome c oxidase subunit II [Chloroflexota bacterium]